jgi:hypothetical protein
MTTLLSNDVGEFLNLRLSTNKGTELKILLEVRHVCHLITQNIMINTYSLLAELLGTLVLRVLDQFHDTTLIGSKASNFTNKIADELGALALDLRN